MKYVITRNQVGAVLPIVFDSHFRHKDIIKDIRKDHAIVSAGVCSTAKGKVRCCGESRSLNAISFPQTDSKILQAFLFPK